MNKEMFKVLGMEPTEDKDLIRKAYMEKLPMHHPEEDPEGFKRLREAYDKALAYKEGEETEDLSETGLWLKKAIEIYENFSSRIDVNAWKELLEDDVSFSLDTAEEASRKLLVYFMEHNWIPHEVLAALEEHFSWEEKKQDLYNQFPINFVDFIISNAKYEDHFRYYAFDDIDPDQDYDTFIKNYFFLLSNIYTGNPETEAVMEENLSLGIKHPDFTILQVRYALRAEELEKAKELADALLEEYPEDVLALYCASQVTVTMEDYETTRKYIDKVLEKMPDHVGAMVTLGDCLVKEEKKEEALELYKKAQKLSPYDGYVLHSIHTINDELATRYKEALEEGTESDAEKERISLELLKAAVGSRRFEDALAAAENVASEVKETYEYYRLMGEAYSGLNKPEEAHSYFEKAFDAYDGDDDKEKADLYADKGVELLNAEKPEDALAIYEEGLAKYPEHSRLLYRKAAALNALKRYSEAVEICDFLLDRENIPNAHHFKADALFQLGEYTQAEESCDAALRIVPYYDTFVIKIKIYEQTYQYEKIVELVDQLIGNNLNTVELKVFKLKALSELGRLEDGEALAKEILEEEPGNMEVYRQMALLHQGLGQYQEALEYLEEMEGPITKTSDFKLLGAFVLRKLKRFDESEEIYEELLKEEDVRDDMIYSHLGFLWEGKEEPEKSAEFFKKALEVNPRHHIAPGKLADFYEDQEDIEKALEYNAIQLENDPTDYFYVQRGILLEKQGDIDGAIECHVKAEQYNSNNPHIHYNMGIFNIKKGRPEEAIPHFQKAVEKEYPYAYAYYNLGICLFRTKRYEEALKAYDEGLDKFPDYNDLIYRKAVLYKNIEEFEKALDCYDKYYKIRGNKAHYYLMASRCYRSWGKTEKALEYCKLAWKADKKDYEPLEDMADIYQIDLKDYKKAVKYYKKALKVGNVSGFTHLGMAECLIELGQQEKAEPYLQDALKLFLKELEEDKDACRYQEVGKVYAAMGDEEKAMEYFKKAIELVPFYKFCPYMECYDTYYEIGMMYEKKGDLVKALSNLEKACDICPQIKYKKALEDVKKKIDQ